MTIVRILLIVLASATPLLAQHGALSGGYYGVQGAEGMRIEIDRPKKTQGTFIDSNGRTAKIEARWVDGAAEAVLAFPTRPVIIRITPETLGAQVLVLPVDLESGQPLTRQARVLSFLKDGVAAPDLPKGYQNPPARFGTVLDPDVFLISYEFWSPDGVARGFDGVGARYRTMIRFFPLIQADVLWKLCAVQKRPPGLAEALRGQGVTCRDIATRITALQRNRKFDRFKRDVAAQRKELLAAVQCSRGYIVKESVCGPAARQLSEAATSLQTVATALSRYR